MAYLIPGKIIAILVFLIGTFLCSYAPFMFKSLRKNPGALGIINAFGGGLFLAGGMIHILPEALHKMEEWYKPVDDDHRLRFLAEEEHEEEEAGEHFPWPAFGAIMIFCLQLVLEKTVGRSANASWLFAAGMGLHATFAGLALGLEKTTGSFMALMIGIISHKFSESIAVGVKIFEEVKPGQIKRYLEVENASHNLCLSPKTVDQQKKLELEDSKFSPAFKTVELRKKSELEDRQFRPAFKTVELQKKSELEVSSAFKSLEITQPEEYGFEKNGFEKNGLEKNGLEKNGLEQAVEVQQAVPLGNFFPLKFLDKAAPLNEAKPEPSISVKLTSYIVLGLFIICTPLGIGIGLAVSDVNKWAEGFLLGLSAGTFIYTGTIHVIPEEFHGKSNLWWKTLAYYLGVGVICGVWFIEHKAFQHDKH